MVELDVENGKSVVGDLLLHIESHERHNLVFTDRR